MQPYLRWARSKCICWAPGRCRRQAATIQLAPHLPSFSAQPFPTTTPHLQQHVDLGGGLVQALLHGDGHPLNQLGQLQLLLLQQAKCAPSSRSKPARKPGPQPSSGRCCCCQQPVHCRCQRMWHSQRAAATSLHWLCNILVRGAASLAPPCTYTRRLTTECHTNPEHELLDRLNTECHINRPPSSAPRGPPCT